MNLQPLLSIKVSAAPALSRGLALLATLAEESPLSLDAISSRLRLPKASAFRLLATLQQLGMIRKTADKTYEPLWVLAPLQDPLARIREQLHEPMLLLAGETECTVEWYEPSPEGMHLLIQKTPEIEVQVKAKQGFLRNWGGELDAVARIGYAFWPQAPTIKRSLENYTSNGLKTPLSPQKAKELIALARSQKKANDVVFNTNGVRRYAVPLMQNSRFFGAVALAECFRFRPTRKPADYLFQLTNTTSQLQ